MGMTGDITWLMEVISILAKSPDAPRGTGQRNALLVSVLGSELPPRYTKKA